MRIEDLDEFQGMTPQMVREWLHKLDPSIKPGASMAEDIQAVSDLCGETPQSLLREINPRMRKGWPSDEALSAHPFWLLNNAPIHCLPSVVTSSFVREKKQRSDPEFADIAPHYAWPCDEHGNKVRWPEKDGVML